MSTKPPNMPDVADPSDSYIRTLAGLEVTLQKLAKGQDDIKAQLKTIAPRLDTLAAEVRENGRLIHHQAKIFNTLTNETSDLHQARVALEKLTEDIRVDSAARALVLERAINGLGKDLEFTDDRVRRLRDKVADALGPEEEGASGVMDKPRM